MKVIGRLREGIFTERLNRFLGRFTLSGEEHLCHVPNPGRMAELLNPGVEIWVQEKSEPRRKTPYDLLFVRKNVLVSIDSRVPNKLIKEAIQRRGLPEFSEYDLAKEEHIYRDSRLDFLLARGGRRMLLEAKSCTLVQENAALFPDASTKRGTKHLRSLMDALGQGCEAAVAFVVQRPDADRFSPNDETDPDFGAALREASSRGVNVYAYICRVSLREIALWKRIRVLL